ncbi:DUF262 domain-containing protein [Desulfoplanes sp.]
MKIATILDQIDAGFIALPEFQRGYVWNRDQVRALMTSLYKRHPVGSLLVWATQANQAAHRGDNDPASGIIELLLDGQQRITSLYGIIRGHEPCFFDGNASVFTGLYFNVENEEFSASIMTGCFLVATPFLSWFIIWEGVVCRTWAVTSRTNFFSGI